MNTPRSSRGAYDYEPVASPDDSTECHRDQHDDEEGHDDDDDEPVATDLYIRRKKDDTPLINKYLCWFIIILLTSLIVHVMDRTTAMNRIAPKLPALQTRPSLNNTTNKIITLAHQHYYRRDPNTTATWPRIAWLMSFPNSGTTYTIEMVTATTNTSTATNYREEAVDDTVPVHSHDTNGPFWNTPERHKPHHGYVMTKTHCGGRCTMCRPNAYVETTRSFEVACRSDKRRSSSSNSSSSSSSVVAVTYKDDAIQRAIHLVRNPFDNLVARLHFDLRKWQKNGGRDRNGRIWPNFTSDREGLTAWCQHMDTKWSKQEQGFRWIDTDLIDMEKGLPCHGEFYRYIQWHNQAIEVSTRRLKLPVLYLYYENYTTNFDETVSTVLDFLNLTQVAPPPTFVKGKHYENYLEAHDYKMGARLIKELATDEAWDVVKHYVERWL